MSEIFSVRTTNTIDSHHLVYILNVNLWFLLLLAQHTLIKCEFD